MSLDNSLALSQTFLGHKVREKSLLSSFLILGNLYQSKASIDFPLSVPLPHKGKPLEELKSPKRITLISKDIVGISMRG